MILGETLGEVSNMIPIIDVTISVLPKKKYLKYFCLDKRLFGIIIVALFYDVMYMK